MRFVTHPFDIYGISKPYDSFEYHRGTSHELVKSPSHCFFIHPRNFSYITYFVINFIIHKQIN